MRNKTAKFIHISLILVVLAGQMWPALALAQVPPDIPAPPDPPSTLVEDCSKSEAGCTGFELICKKSAGIASCIQKIYLFSLGLGGIIALLMVVLAGYRYMTASGNAEAVSSAKESLESAFKGLIIIFVGFILLYLINPDLVQFNSSNTFFKPIKFNADGTRKIN